MKTIDLRKWVKIGDGQYELTVSELDRQNRELQSKGGGLWFGEVFIPDDMELPTPKVETTVDG